MVMKDFALGPRLGDLVETMVASYGRHKLTQHIDREYLPNRGETVQLVRSLLELLFPGFIGRQHLTKFNMAFHVGDLLPAIAEIAYRQINNCLCYEAETLNPDSDADVHVCTKRARDMTLAFIEDLPHIREMLEQDVEAAFDGDPAASHTDEVIMAYPGMLAITVYRVANSLHNRGVPLMPRIMTEWAHSKTGIDIHPGATIGRRFFVDHGTGVVIGETTHIGENVKVYQGVTLGALSFPKDERGRIIREEKRHPTVEDNVTIYANAIVLGGATVIGRNAVIGGSVFVTSSVPPDSVVTFKPPELRVKSKNGSPLAPTSSSPEAKGKADMPDYMI